LVQIKDKTLAFDLEQPKRDQQAQILKDSSPKELFSMDLVQVLPLTLMA
jgi:hypothetical protein